MDLSMIRFTFSLCLKRDERSPSTTFKIPSQTKKLQSPVHTNSFRHVKYEQRFEWKRFLFKSPLHGLKDSAKILFQTIAERYKALVPQTMKKVTCIFLRNGMVIICYVDELLVFSGSPDKITHCKTQLSRHFVPKHLGHATQSVRIELLWIEYHTVGMT